jgi:hypothetical protein
MVDRIEIGERNIEGTRLRGGHFGCWHAKTLQPLGDARAEQIHEMTGGRAGPQTQAHAGMDFVQRHDGCFALLLVAQVCLNRLH